MVIFFLRAGNKDVGSPEWGNSRGKGDKNPGGQASKVTTRGGNGTDGRPKLPGKTKCQARPGERAAVTRKLVPVTAGWRPEEESVDADVRLSHTVQTRTPTRTPSWLYSQGRGGRGGSAGAGRRAGTLTSKTTSVYALPLTPLPREFGRRPEINRRWRWLRKPC